MTPEFEKAVAMISVHPDTATRGDIAIIAAELMNARHALHKILYFPESKDAFIDASKMREIAGIEILGLDRP